MNKICFILCLIIFVSKSEAVSKLIFSEEFINQNVTNVTKEDIHPLPHNITSDQIRSEIMPEIKPKLELKLMFSDEFNENEINEEIWEIITEMECIVY